MITSAIIGVLLSVINIVISIWPIPASGLPSQVTSAFVTLNNTLGSANAFFPVADLLAALSIFLTAELAMFTIKGIMVIWKMLRG